MKKNNEKGFFEKLHRNYSYITVISIAITLSVVICFSSISEVIEVKRGVLFFCIWAFAICVLRYLYLYQTNSSFRLREVDSFKLGIGSKILNIMPSDQIKYRKVLSDVVDFWDITPGGSFSVVYAIKYRFRERNQKEFFGLKRISDWSYIFTPNLPKVGDKIEILYNKNDPTDSVILYQKAEKVKWYKWQPKYEIKVIQ